MKIRYKLFLIIGLSLGCLGTVLLMNSVVEARVGKCEDLHATILRLSNHVFRAYADQRIFLEKGTGRQRVFDAVRQARSEFGVLAESPYSDRLGDLGEVRGGLDRFEEDFGRVAGDQERLRHQHALLSATVGEFAMAYTRLRERSRGADSRTLLLQGSDFFAWCNRIQLLAYRDLRADRQPARFEENARVARREMQHIAATAQRLAAASPRSQDADLARTMSDTLDGVWVILDNLAELDAHHTRLAVELEISERKLRGGCAALEQSAESLARATEARLRTFQQGMVALLVIFAASGALSIVSSVNVSLSRLVEAVRRVAAGDLEFRLPTERRDEFSELGRAFNHMTLTLCERTAERENLIGKLEAKNDELERFTYVVSHDLRSPLITVKSYLAVLGKDLAAQRTDQIDDDLARISNAADQMGHHLDDLLELSRVGRVVGPPVAIPLAELVAECLEFLAGPMALKGVEVEVEPDMPTIYGDRLRWREVVQNLLENAVKFSPPRQPAVQVGTRRDGDETVCFVRDNGIGIDPRDHGKIFGLFEKMEEGKDGSGIGLALVKRIVEVHGGRVWVESEGRGQGTTFCFTVPVAPR